eukprot:scaffold52689_cov29-Phaeocystis_antarctica.AAC.1
MAPQGGDAPQQPPQQQWAPLAAVTVMPVASDIADPIADPSIVTEVRGPALRREAPRAVATVELARGRVAALLADTISLDLIATAGGAQSVLALGRSRLDACPRAVGPLVAEVTRVARPLDLTPTDRTLALIVAEAAALLASVAVHESSDAVGVTAAVGIRDVAG